MEGAARLPRRDSSFWPGLLAANKATSDALMREPPKSWSDLRDLLGEQDARRIVDRYGGQQLVVPSKYDPRCRLARVLGKEPLSLLVRFWGGCPIYVPTMAAARRAVRDRRIPRRRAEGVPVREIARSEGLKAPRVRSILVLGGW